MKKLMLVLAGLMTLALSATAGSADPVSWFNGGVASGFPNDATMSGGAWSNTTDQASWDSTLKAVQLEAGLTTPVSFTNLSPKALGGPIKTVTYNAKLSFIPFETTAKLPFAESPSKGGVALVSNETDFAFYVLAKDGENATNKWTQTSVAGLSETETNVTIAVTRADSSGVASVAYTIAQTTLPAMDLVIGDSSFSSVALTGDGTLSALSGSCVSNIVSITIPENPGADISSVTIAGKEIEPPYTDLEGVKGDAVVITYTAQSGYYFAGGVTSATVEGTAGAEITIPSDKQAVAAEAKIGSTYYYQLKDAVAAVAADQTIELNSDVTLPEALVIKKNFSFAIDGNDKTLTAVDGLSIPLSISGYSADNKLAVSDLTISNITCSTKLMQIWSNVSADFNNVTIADCSVTGYLIDYQDAYVTFNGCTFIDNETSSTLMYNGGANGIGVILTITNSLFKSNTSGGSAIFYIAKSAKNFATIVDNTFDGNTENGSAIMYLSQTATITGNLFKDNTVVSTATGTGKIGVLAGGSGSVGSVANNNAFVNNSVTAGAGQTTATIWLAPIWDVDGNYWDDGSEPEYGDTKDVVAESGAETSYAASYLTAYTAKASGRGIEAATPAPVAAAKAKIGEKYYLTFAKAFEKADGEPVALFKDLTDSVTSTVASATLDLAGYTLSPSDAAAPLVIAKGEDVNLLLVDSSANKAGKATSATTTAAIVAEGGATVYVDDVDLTGNTKAILANASTVIISNGWFDGEIATASNGDIDLFGGYYKTGVSFVENSGTIDGYAGRFESAAASAPAGVPAEGYKYAPFGVAFTTNSVEFQSSIETNAGVAASVWAVVDSKGNQIGGTYQVSDAFAATAAEGKSGADAQKELSASAQYTGGTMTKWQCYVLGMESAATTSTAEGPYVKGVQDANASTIGFQLLTPAMIKAAESGCKVEYQVESYGNSSLSGGVRETSEKVDYSQPATIAVPDDGTVRYYKLKVSITPKQ